MKKAIAVAAVLLLLSVGCNKAKVTASDLAGTWMMKDASRLRLPAELQKASAKIVLDANGTFVASEMPGLFYIPPARAWLDAGSGVWTLVSREGGQQIQLNFHVIANRNQTDVPYGTQLYVSAGWSAVSLFYSLGDPDEGRRVEFERK